MSDRITIGNVRSKNPDVFDNLGKVIADVNNNYETWYEKMREVGVVIIHPDDGWVDRKRNIVRLCYPKVLKDLPRVGDLVALGCYWKYRLVRITAITEMHPICLGMLKNYYFVEVDDD